MSNSTSALRGRNAGSASFLTFQNSNYQILENIRSGIGEWNSVFGTDDELVPGRLHLPGREPRHARRRVFPFVEIYEGGTLYTAFGYEPFTLNNELRYKTLQFQNNLTRFGDKHSQTFGAYVERFQSENVFFSCCPQSAYSYNSLADFYTDANNYLANRNRTTSPISLAQFQVRYSNIPGNDKATQELDVWYTAGYAQDEWRVRPNLSVTSGIRFDVTRFKNDSFANPAADGLTFRDETGSGALPDRPDAGSQGAVVAACRHQLGCHRRPADPGARRDRHFQRQAGLRVGVESARKHRRPDRGDSQHGAGQRVSVPPRSGPLQAGAHRRERRELHAQRHRSRVQVPAGVADNIGLDHKLPGGFISTTEYFFAKNINGVYYIDANLPAAQTAFSGPDARPRWTANRLNTTPGNVVNNAFVLKNGEGGSSWNFAQMLPRNFRSGLSLRAAYSYGESTTLVDPESTAATTFARVTHFQRSEQRRRAELDVLPGHRGYALVSYSREYFKLGATTITAFWETRPSTNSGRLAQLHLCE